jgi:hypothetical protein
VKNPEIIKQGIRVQTNNKTGYLNSIQIIKQGIYSKKPVVETGYLTFCKLFRRAKKLNLDRFEIIRDDTSF